MSDLAEFSLIHPSEAECKQLIFIEPAQYAEWLSAQSEFQRHWLISQAYAGSAGSFCLLPEQNGQWQKVLVCIAGDNPYAVAHLPKVLPATAYQISNESRANIHTNTLVLGWGLGAYQFSRYAKKNPLAQLQINASDETILAILQASYQVRDLINTPAEHMGPDDLEHSARNLAQEFSAEFHGIKGDELLSKNFPTIHAVGRASPRAPRILRLDWGIAEHPHVVLCGKGVCFDTGGLDIKGADGMRNMKKDMGGAAHALGIARLIMQLQLPIRLTLLIAAVDNAIAGNAFRPGDVITTRAGLSIEIDNTDAEGRLVLADTLALASELQPDLIMDFATLTGAARIALGPDLPALFSNRDALAKQYLQAGNSQHDPLWHMPLWQPYMPYLRSNIADLANSGASKMAGCVTAALFLQRFVKSSIDWTHVDVYSWNDSERPGKPAGGEAQGLRAALAFLQARYGNQ